MSQQVNLGGQQPQVNLNVNAQQGPQGPRADLPQELRNAQLATRHYPSFLRGVANFFLSVGHTIMEGVRSIANFFSTSPTPPEPQAGRQGGARAHRSVGWDTAVNTNADAQRLGDKSPQEFNNDIRYGLRNDFHETASTWPVAYLQAVQQGLEDAGKLFPDFNCTVQSFLDDSKFKTMKNKCADAIDNKSDDKLTPQQLRETVKNAVLEQLRLGALADKVKEIWTAKGLEKQDSISFRSIAKGVLNDLAKTAAGNDPGAAREARKLLETLNTGNAEALGWAVNQTSELIESRIELTTVTLPQLTAAAKQNALDRLSVAFGVPADKIALKSLDDKISKIAMDIESGAKSPGPDGLEGIFSKAIDKFVEPYRVAAESIRNADIPAGLKKEWLDALISGKAKPFDPTLKLDTAIITAGSAIDVSAIMNAAGQKPANAENVYKALMDTLSQGARNTWSNVHNAKKIQAGDNAEFGADEKFGIFTHLPQIILAKNPGLREALQPFKNELQTLHEDYRRHGKPPMSATQEAKDEYSSRLELGEKMIEFYL